MATVSWSAPNATGGTISGYRVEKNGGAPVVLGNVLSWEDAAAVDGDTYRVAAVNQYGQGLWSAAATYDPPAGAEIVGTDLGEAAVGAATNAVRTLTTAVAVGSTIVVATVNATTTGPTVSDSSGHTYTERIVMANGTNHTTRIFTARATAGLSIGSTITVTPGRADVGTAMSASAWTGIAASSPVDGTASAESQVTTTTPSAGSITASTQPQLLFAAFGNTSPDRTHTPSAGWTFLQKTAIPSDFIRALQTQYRIVTATGSYTASGTLDTATTWSAAAIGLKAG